MERLAKFIARCGISSRRGAETFIQDGIVRVNGKTVTDCATLVDPENDHVKVKNTLLRVQQHIYILFNKPPGIITTRSDERKRKTVFDFLPAKMRMLHPVGRLDKESEGLLLLTNDGALTFRLTHPRHHIEKTYMVTIEGMVKDAALDQLRRGIRLEKGKTLPAQITVHKQGEKSTYLCMQLREGKKRQIRRMFERVGYRVIDLKRVSVGNIRLGNLKKGTFRHLAKKEVADLYRLCS